MKLDSIILFCELLTICINTISALSNPLCVEEDIKDSFTILDGLETNLNISSPEKCMDLCNANYLKGCAITQGSICVCHNVTINSFKEVKLTLCNLTCTGSTLTCGSNDGFYSYYISSNTVKSNYKNVYIEAELIPNQKSFNLNLTIVNADSLPDGYFLTLQSGINGHRFKISPSKILIEDWSIYRLSFGMDKFLSAAVHDSKDHILYHSEVEVTYSGEYIATELICPILIEVNGPEMFCRLMYINDIYADFKLEITSTNDESNSRTDSFYLSNPSCTNLGKTPPLYTSFINTIYIYYTSTTDPIILRHLGPATSRTRFISIVGLFGANSLSTMKLNVYNTKCPLLSLSGKCLSEEKYERPTIQNLEHSVNASTCNAKIHNIISHQCQEGCTALPCHDLKGTDYPKLFNLKNTYELKLSETESLKSSTQTLLYTTSGVEVILEEGDYIGVEGNIEIAYLLSQDPKSYSVQKDAHLKMELLLQATVCDVTFVDTPINCEETKWLDITVKNLNTSSVIETARVLCQDAIRDVNITIVGDSTIQKDAWIESSVYYFKVDEEITMNIERVNGTSINYTVFWDDGSSNDTEFGDDEVMLKKIKKTYSNKGNFKVQIFMENLHSNESLKDALNKYIHNYTFTFNIYNPVEKWTHEKVLNWLSTDGDYCFKWKSDPSTQLPSYATINCVWGSESITSSEETNFEDPIYLGKTGSISYCVNHTFESGGTYDLNCTMENKVSKQNLTIENVTIYIPIEGFETSLSFVPKFGDGTLIPGYGKEENIIPHGRNITFKFSIEKGVIEKLQFVNTSSNESIGSWWVKNNDIMTFTHEHFFPDEGVLNIRVIGSNAVTQAQYNLTFEIIKNIRIMSIKDDGASTRPKETKVFKIEFVTFGGGVCIEINFGDEIMEAYGDPEFCRAFVSNKLIQIHEEDITNPFEIEHVYFSMGSYDVTARASNPATKEDLSVEMKNVLILDFDCKVPKVSLNLETAEPNNPFEFFKREQVKLSGKILVDCYEVEKTLKKWVFTLMKLNSGIAKEDKRIDNSDLSSQKLENADVSILPFQFPYYGLYKVTLFSRLWDDRDIGDPYLTHILPYEGQSSTFIRVLPSPLVPGLVRGGSKYISRGTGQIVDLKPYLYTNDPDSPKDKVKGIEFKWFCRHMTSLTNGEKYPLEKMDQNGNQSISEANPQKIHKKKMRIENSKGGCFGYGPGILDEYESVLLIPGSSFIKTQEKYEIMIIASKDTRTARTSVIVEIFDGNPPIISIDCAKKDESCHVDDKGNIYINPDFRLALSSSCSTEDSSDCSEPMRYEWSLIDEKNAGQVDDKYFTIGSDLSDFIISMDFFEKFPDLQTFDVKLIAHNAKDDKGICLMTLRVNKPPTGGSCSVSPMKGTALIDTFLFHCSNWIDPENKKVSSYTLKTKDASGSMNTLKQFSIFGSEKEEIRLPPGELQIVVLVEDIWGGITTYQMPDQVQVIPPSKEELKAFRASMGDTDAGSSASVLQIMSNLMKSDPSLFDEAEDESLPEDINEFNQAVTAGMNKIQLLAKLEELTKNKFTDVSTLESLSGTIANTLGEPGSNTVGLAATEFGLNSLENLIKNLVNVKIPSPDRLLTSASQIANGLGTIIDAITKPGKESKKTDKDCANVAPVDMSTAETSSVFQYDTDIGDDLEMEIPQDDDKLKCEGVKDSFKVVAKKMGGRVKNIIKDLGDATLNMLVIHENITVKTSKVLLHVRKTMIENLKDEIHLTNGTSFQVENFCTVKKMNGTCRQPVGVIASLMKDNIYGYYGNSHLISDDAAILDLTLKDTNTMKTIIVRNVNMTGINGTSHGGIKLKLSRGGTKKLSDDLSIVDAIERSKAHRIPYMHHEFTFAKTNASLTIEFILLNISAVIDLPHMVMLLSFERIPTHDSFEYGAMVENLKEIEEYHFVWYLRNEKIRGHDGRWFLTIAQLSKVLSTKELSQGSIDKELLIPISYNYKIRPYTSGCYFFDEERSDWFNDMNVTSTDDKSLICRSTHLTAFGAGFFITPNTIDFEFVLARSSFNDNLTAYFTLFIAIFIFVIMMIWAYFKDKKEKKLNFSRVCPDNKVEDKYMYEILTQTDMRYQSSCSSVVNIFISGDNGDTGLRILRSTDVDSTLNKGNINSFILTTSGPLGKINLVRIWLNYTGESHFASWYLSSLLIRDIQTNEEFEFIVNDWFALEKSDGRIDRRITPPTLEQKTCFQHLFTHLFEQNIKNNHFWFSVFMKQPLTSRYTTCQRVMTAFTFFFLCMLLNGLWYGKFAMGQPSKFEFRTSLFNLTPVDLGMGLLSCLIANPFAYIISFLFKKSKVNRLKETRFHSAITYGERDGYVFEGLPPKASKNKLFLPYWCSMLAWILSFLTLLVSFIMIWGYAISFGKDKIHQWLASVVVSLFVDLLIFELLKIIVIAAIRSCLKKPIDLDSTDIRDREILPRISTSDIWRKPDKNNSYFEPYNKAFLEQLKLHRVSDVNIMAVIREMMYYFLFLAVIVIVSYGNRDTNSYLLKWNLEQRFIYDNHFDQISNTVEWWEWVHGTILPKLRASNFYNGKPPIGLRGFLDDQVNRIMGYATLRQIRVKPNSCRVSSIVSNLTRNCAPATNIYLEDSRHYCDNWAERTDLTFDLPSCQRPEFRYENASSLQSLSYNAIVDAYSGGGYVVHLKGPSAKINQTLLLLQDLNWINNHTRAVFFEFSVYNANTNLFGIVTIIAEFFPGGGMRPFWRIDPVRLFKHYDFDGIVVLISECIFVLVIFYFTAKEVLSIKKYRGNYFKGYWFIGEWVVIFSAYAAIGLYIYRLLLSIDILRIFGKTYGNGYVKFQLVGLADEYFIYFMGIIVFVCTLKIMKLLQFNRKFSVITMTLNRCWRDLKGFFVVFFFVFFAFVQLFYIILNSEIFDFHTLIYSFETCFTMLLNKFKFGSLNQTSITAAIMFFLFSFTCTWVLINMLITIIIEGFDRVKTEIVDMKNDLEILEFLHYRSSVLSGKKEKIVYDIMRSKDSIQMEPVLDYPEEEDENEDDQLYLLSEKVDEFVRFIDKVYFEGSLNATPSQYNDTEHYLQKPQTKIIIS